MVWPVIFGSIIGIGLLGWSVYRDITSLQGEERQKRVVAYICIGAAGILLFVLTLGLKNNLLTGVSQWLYGKPIPNGPPFFEMPLTR